MKQYTIWGSTDNNSRDKTLFMIFEARPFYRNMVRVLQAYNFAKQNTFAINGEILSATLINENKIAISSAEQFIEIFNVSSGAYDSQNGSTQVSDNGNNRSIYEPNEAHHKNDQDNLPAKYSLATVGEVINLIYCEAGKYLLTLERENVGSPVHSNSTSISCTSSSNSATTISEDDIKMFVRIYTNFWKFPDSKLIDIPITIRIASMTTPKAPLMDSIDVIELPLRSPPDLIQCCQISGNIIVSSKDRIYLFEYSQCTHETTQPRFTYIDFLPFKFFVNLNFVPLKLCLAENVIACMNTRYCVAFKIVDITGSGSAFGTHSSNPLDNDYDGAQDDVDIVDADEPISSSASSIASKVSGGPSSNNSFESDSLETTCSRVGVTGFPGRTPVDFNVARIVNSACGREFEVDLKSQWEQNESAVGSASDTQEIIIYPARANVIKIKLVNEAKAMNVSRITSHGKIASPHCIEDTSVQYDIKKLLQICMKTSDPNSRIVEILRCMDLKAIYQRIPEDEDEGGNDENVGNKHVSGDKYPIGITNNYFRQTNTRTLKSNIHQHCVGYSLLVATSVDGYLYQFCAQGKWYNENEKPIAVYSFTAPVLKVHINDYVIYAITTESVELHTSRIGHKLFNNRFEYPTISSMFPEESSPDVNAPIAVIGLFSFMNVQFVSVNRDNLVLISNCAMGLPNQAINYVDGSVQKRKNGSVEMKRNIAARLLAEAKAKHNQFRNGSASQPATTNEWTVYNLQVPKIETVIEDLEMLAETFKTASSSNFYDLMEEAHVMLRLSLSLEFACLSGEQEQNLRAKFTENCHKLADFSIRSKKKDVYLQATGFYKMCSLQLPEIYSNFITNFLASKADEYKVGDAQNFESDSENLIGLIYTVKLYLINLGTDRQKATFLHQLVKPYFTRNKNYDSAQPITQHVPLALEFLNMFILCSPADIPQIMLNSPIVADIVSADLIAYLRHLEKRSPEENLLLAFIASRMSNYILSQDILSKTSRKNLATALIKHKNVLFDDGTKLYQRQRDNGSTAKSSTSRRNGQSHSNRRNRRKCSSAGCQATASFSDFTETILLATENTELIEAISDVFIHALCIEHSVSLEMILQLFLNYIATHIGHKGYHSSQKVFVNILQVYYYDLFDVNPLSNNNDMRSTTPPPNIEGNDDDEASSNTISLNGAERDNESLSNSIAESNSCASSSIEERVGQRTNRIVFEQLQEDSHIKRNSSTSLVEHDIENVNANETETNLKGLKILFRMYLGRLKAVSDLIGDLEQPDIEPTPINEELISLRMECIRFLARHLQELKIQQQHRLRITGTSSLNFYYSKVFGNASNQGYKKNTNNEKKLIFVPFIPDYKLSASELESYLRNYIRPIPCLVERPQYLNRLPPFQRSDFSYPDKDDGTCEVHFVGWHNEMLSLTLKIQSLLSSTKIDREIVEEFVSFIQKSPNLLGIDSFLVIILPKNLAINYMLNFCPEYIWQYGKSNNFTPKHWESLLKKIINKQKLLSDWKTHVTEILNNLVDELTFEELLQCFPSEVISNRNAEDILKNADNRCIFDEQNSILLEEKDTKIYEKYPRNHMAMDNIDENNVFEVILRKAVSKQRSLALRSMIESTGTQLFDATSNPMYNLN